MAHKAVGTKPAAKAEIASVSRAMLSTLHTVDSLQALVAMDNDDKRASMAGKLEHLFGLRRIQDVLLAQRSLTDVANQDQSGELERIVAEIALCEAEVNLLKAAISER
jgi:hypothetical protein